LGGVQTNGVDRGPGQRGFDVPTTHTVCPILLYTQPTSGATAGSAAIDSGVTMGLQAQCRGPPSPSGPMTSLSQPNPRGPRSISRAPSFRSDSRYVYLRFEWHSMSISRKDLTRYLLPEQSTVCDLTSSLSPLDPITFSVKILHV
jgi:hypothetical protein